VEQNTQYIEEETIDIRELFAILTKRKKLIWLITALFTLLALAYVFIAKPVYEVKAVLELAQINKKPVHPVETIKQKIVTVFQVNDKSKKIEFPIVSQVSIPKKSENILIIHTQGYDNASAKKKLQEAISYINNAQKKELNTYEKLQKKRLNITQSDMEQNEQFINKTKNDIRYYENKILNISKQDAALAGIYAIEIGKKETDLNLAVNKIYTLKNKKNDLEFSLSPQRVQKTEIIGEFQVLEKPIKPKKKLIVIVAFITGLMLAVFLAFFLEFLSGGKKED